jgi:3-dehydroquinate dehydratase-2
MNKILVLNGPNLNLLGEREPDVYGKYTLDEIQKFTEDQLKKFGFDKVNLNWFQSNSESDLIEKIQTEKDNVDAIVINPAAYTHTSVAILDVLKACKKPVVEVHLSNTNVREEFRKNKVTTLASKHVVEGAGHRVYLLGILSLLI